MKKLNRVLAAFCLAAVLTSGAVTASAATLEEVQEPAVEAAAVVNPADPCSDVIETKYRTTVDHHIQYRRWNATRGYWVDPHWIDLW